MLIHVMLATIALGGAPLPVADTVIPVDRGTRLEVENHRGDVIVRSRRGGLRLAGLRRRTLLTGAPEERHSERQPQKLRAQSRPHGARIRQFVLP